ncbi:MAG TPA: hypothetical protein VJB02_02125 [Coxiellaceae bacterium]|nr:hypothetical protein [Coxiellaceae bacterium]
MNWPVFFYVIGGGLMLWVAVRLIKNNPGAFSKERLSQSSTTLALLTLLLIGIIAVAVLVLRQS